MERIIAILLVFISMVIWLPVLLIQLFVHPLVFFVQTRAGRNEKLFKLYKFQSIPSKKVGAKTVPNWWGRFLRGTSIDEVPQLVNIIKGDMAFVGPRPLLPEYVSLYSTAQKKRHQVKPGLTGWAQVNGRNNLSWNEQFELDLWYVQNKSLRLDAKIIVLTVMSLFSRKKGETRIREPFTGN
jgi:undecaprenyl phosphate N,N'-diacetylbacillosamine 1-phosphate transferase